MADEQDAQVNADAAAAPKKSKKMLFVIIGIAILLLGGGGFFAYTQFLAPKPATEDVQMDKDAAVAPDVIGSIFKLSAFTVNLADPKGKRYLKLQVEIELESEVAVELATRAEPKLRDMVIMLLTSLTFEDVMTPEGKIRIRDELLDRFNRIMRPERVKNIYFTEFVVQ